jgi:hypothetical protein
MAKHRPQADTSDFCNSRRAGGQITSFYQMEESGNDFVATGLAARTAAIARRIRLESDI